MQPRTTDSLFKELYLLECLIKSYITEKTVVEWYHKMRLSCKQWCEDYPIVFGGPATVVQMKVRPKATMEKLPYESGKPHNH